MMRSRSLIRPIRLPLALLTASLILGGCSLFKPKVDCADPKAAEAATAAFRDSIEQAAKQRVRDSINQGNGLDIGMLPQMLRSLEISLRQISTSGSGGDSTQCQAELIVDVPAATLKRADATRQAFNQPSLTNLAVLSDLELDNGQISQKVTYPLLRNQSGELAVNETGKAAAVDFTGQVLFDALSQVAPQVQTELNSQVAGSETTALRDGSTVDDTLPDTTGDSAATTTTATATAETSAAVPVVAPLSPLQKARLRFKKADDRLNRVWQAADQDAQREVLPAQRRWLAKRDRECELSVAEMESATSRDIARWNCRASATEARVSRLRSQLRNAAAGETAVAAPRRDGPAAEPRPVPRTEPAGPAARRDPPATDERAGPAYQREQDSADSQARQIARAAAEQQRLQAETAERQAAERAARQARAEARARAEAIARAEIETEERQARGEAAYAEQQRLREAAEASRRAAAEAERRAVEAERRAIEEQVAQENAAKLSRGVREAQSQLSGQ